MIFNALISTMAKLFSKPTSGTRDDSHTIDSVQVKGVWLRDENDT